MSSKQVVPSPSPGAGAPLPAAPWKPSVRQVRARTPISLARMVDAALRVIDAEGTDGVTMRRIATDLGTGPASLYAHVASRQDLLRHAHDRIIGEIEFPDFAALPWPEAVRLWAHRTYDVYRAHNDIARLSLADIPTDSTALTAMESMSSALIAAGVPVQVAMWALDRLALYIAADAYEGWLYAQRFAADTPEESERIGTQYYAQVAAFFGSLPRQQFPTILANLPVMVAGDGRERFEMGLDLIIDGIASRAR